MTVGATFLFKCFYIKMTRLDHLRMASQAGSLSGFLIEAFDENWIMVVAGCECK